MQYRWVIMFSFAVYAPGASVRPPRPHRTRQRFPAGSPLRTGATCDDLRAFPGRVAQVADLPHNPASVADRVLVEVRHDFRVLDVAPAARPVWFTVGNVSAPGAAPHEGVNLVISALHHTPP